MGFHWATYAYDAPIEDAYEKAVFAYLAHRCDDDTGLARPSLVTIQEKTSMSRRGVIRVLKRLEAGGHISVIRPGNGRGMANRYQLERVSTSHPLRGLSVVDNPVETTVKGDSQSVSPRHLLDRKGDSQSIKGCLPDTRSVRDQRTNNNNAGEDDLELWKNEFVLAYCNTLDYYDAHRHHLHRIRKEITGSVVEWEAFVQSKRDIPNGRGGVFDIPSLIRRFHDHLRWEKEHVDKSKPKPKKRTPKPKPCDGCGGPRGIAPTGYQGRKYCDKCYEDQVWNQPTLKRATGS